MGIYAERYYEDENGHRISIPPRRTVPYVEVVSEPGVVWKRTVTPSEWTEERTDCYCCSCGERVGSDPACRNHGFAAKRPCDIHNLPGSEWDPEFMDGLEGVMPEPVSKARKTY